AEQTFTQRTTVEWLTILRQAGYPCGPYNMPHEALRDPHAIENGYVVELEHPVFGSYRATGMPFQMEKSSATVSGPSPSFAAHTRQVLDEVGLDDDLVADLIASGAVIDRALD
ncbi:MAG: CoA transferase, partial [Acidimicrobiaceae bacterium]|nr:CoA transferase [Acidimicrobiaceae bacterium]